MPSKSTLEFGFEDFNEVFRLGLQRGHALLSAGEALIADRIANLDHEAGYTFAWLIQRKPQVFFEPELTTNVFDDWEQARQHLLELELIDTLVPWPRRAQALPKRLLAPACRSLSICSTGSRAQLVERLSGHTHWLTGRWIRMRHHNLVRRLLRFGTLRVRPDLHQRTLDRLHERRWPSYEIDEHLELFAMRRDLYRWETLVATIDVLSAADLRRTLDRGDGYAPARLNRTHAICRRLFALARDHERGGEWQEAQRCYDALAQKDPRQSIPYHIRWARCAELAGSPHQALDRLIATRSGAQGPDRLALSRSLRRIARLCGHKTGPEQPLLKSTLRTIKLSKGPQRSNRPTFVVDGSAHHVEAAIVALLSRSNRRAIHGEGRLWTLVFALIFSGDVTFLPIAEQLPIRRLSGPLDLGKPEFFLRRREAIRDILAAIRRGEAVSLIQRNYASYNGCELTGADWSLASGEELETLIAAMPPESLIAILEPLLQFGWRAARGLPDLVILPGDPIKLPGFPRRLGPGLHFVEVKTPSDTVSDEQQVWLHILVKNLIKTERWEVDFAASTAHEAHDDNHTQFAKPAKPANVV